MKKHAIKDDKNKTCLFRTNFNLVGMSPVRPNLTLNDHLMRIFGLKFFFFNPLKTSFKMFCDGRSFGRTMHACNSVKKISFFWQKCIWEAKTLGFAQICWECKTFVFDSIVKSKNFSEWNKKKGLRPESMNELQHFFLVWLARRCHTSLTVVTRY